MNINIKSRDLYNITKDVLISLGYDYKRKYVEIDKDKLRSYSMKHKTKDLCIVYVDANNIPLEDLYCNFEIDIKNHFFDNGIFITTRILPIEITNKNENFQVDLVDRNTITKFLIDSTRQKLNPLFAIIDYYQNLQIKVKFKDGTEFTNNDNNKYHPNNRIHRSRKDS